MKALFLILALTACSSEYHAGRVSHTFTATDPAVREELSRDLARISSATGIADLRVGADGIPVVRATDIPDTDCDCTHVRELHGDWWTDHISLGMTRGAGCWDEETSLLHELIHALAPSADHAESGLFRASIQSDKLDSEAVAILCSHVECSGFNPER
jgi:hypothetical protein